MRRLGERAGAGGSTENWRQKVGATQQELWSCRARRRTQRRETAGKKYCHFWLLPTSGTWRPASNGVRVVQSTGARFLSTEQGGKTDGLEWGLKKN